MRSKADELAASVFACLGEEERTIVR